MYGNAAEKIPRNTFSYIGKHLLCMLAFPVLLLDLHCGEICKARFVVVYLNNLLQ